MRLAALNGRIEVDTHSSRLRAGRGGAPRVFLIGVFDGVGCAAVAPSRLGCTIAGYASSEIDKNAKRT
eukprot:4022080-Pyramimonas_sp.AAC.1